MRKEQTYGVTKMESKGEVTFIIDVAKNTYQCAA